MMMNLSIVLNFSYNFDFYGKKRLKCKIEACLLVYPAFSDHTGYILIYFAADVAL